MTTPPPDPDRLLRHGHTYYHVVETRRYGRNTAYILRQQGTRLYRGMFRSGNDEPVGDVFWLPAPPPTEEAMKLQRHWICRDHVWKPLAHEAEAGRWKVLCDPENRDRYPRLYRRRLRENLLYRHLRLFRVCCISGCVGRVIDEAGECVFLTALTSEDKRAAARWNARFSFAGVPSVLGKPGAGWSVGVVPPLGERGEERR